MRRRQRGFTLLEVVLALAIAASLLVIAFGGMRIALAAWRQGEERAEAHQHVRGVALVLARAVGGTYPYQAPPGEAPEPVLLFAGSESRLEFVTHTATVPSRPPIAFSAMVIALSAAEERSGLVVRQRPLPNRNPFDEAAVVFHDPAVTHLALRYLDDDGNWQEAWDGRTQNRLPRAVRLEIGTTIGGRTERLPPLTVSLRVGVQ